jgi:queuosine precursor transporter
MLWYDTKFMDLMILGWIAGSLFLASLIALAGKKYGSWITISAVASLAVISNVLAAAKIVEFPFGLHSPAGILAYSILFFLLDTLNEFYGKKEARKAMVAGILGQVITVPLIWLVLQWPAAAIMTPEKIEAAQVALGLSPQLFVASIIAFAVASNLNIWLYSALKSKTHGGYIWLRNNTSTIVSVFVSNLIFIPLGFWGAGVPILKMIQGHSLVQIMIAAIDTIFIYFLIYAMKKVKPDYLLCDKHGHGKV